MDAIVDYNYVTTALLYIYLNLNELNEICLLMNFVGIWIKGKNHLQAKPAGW
jgi:hypothetical protein